MCAAASKVRTFDSPDQKAKYFSNWVGVGDVGARGKRLLARLESKSSCEAWSASAWVEVLPILTLEPLSLRL